MALDRLAPDQRAVVQLVLQQERSYEELADLLGISADAVRERARRGLERLDEGSGLDEATRSRVTDYLLGQQTVSGREATRELLAADESARSWAQKMAGELAGVARSPLPEVPARAAAPAGPAGPAVVTPGAEPEPATTVPDPPAAADRPVRARPRPRTDRERAPRASGGGREGAERPRSSLLGGALLIGGVALVVAALVAWLVWGGDDDGGERAGEGSATPTATATPSVQPAGQIQMRQPGGGDARGQMTIFVSEDGQVAFTIEGTDMPELERGEAFAMWLTGGERPHRLGFITDDTPGDGKVGSSGPQERDARRFPQWLAEAKQVLVTRETTQETAKPGSVVLRGNIPGSGG